MRCAFCHDALDPGSSPCGGCGTQLHADCWDLLSRSGCPTLGCEGGFVTRQTRRLRFALDPAEPQLPGPLLLSLLALAAAGCVGGVLVLNGVEVPGPVATLLGIGAFGHLLLVPVVGLNNDMQRGGARASLARATGIYAASLCLLTAVAALLASLVVNADDAGLAPLAIALGSFCLLPSMARRLAYGLFVSDDAPRLSARS